MKCLQHWSQSIPSVYSSIMMENSQVQWTRICCCGMNCHNTVKFCSTAACTGLWLNDIYIAFLLNLMSPSSLRNIPTILQHNKTQGDKILQCKTQTHHFQTLTISSSEPVTMVSDPSASLLPHAAVQMASSCAEKKQKQVKTGGVKSCEVWDHLNIFLKQIPWKQPKRMF